MSFQSPKSVLIGSGNTGKTREFRSLFSGLPFKFLDLSAFPLVSAPEESGNTFRDNAEIKARSYALQTGKWVIADDSGLVIDALGGEPGVHSARFAGKNSSYAEKMDAILQRLAASEVSDRNAKFVSSIVLSKPDGMIAFAAEGLCAGTIADQPAGSGGFGYDSIFIPEGSSATFAEMSDSEKELISHRGRAAREFIRQMLDFIGV